VVGDYLGHDITTQNCQIRIGKLKWDQSYERLGFLFVSTVMERIESDCHYPKGTLFYSMKNLKIVR
jgi:hypothetical protein